MNNIDIKKDDIHGRFGVANKFIKRGEIVIVEEPYSFVPTDAYLEVCCSYCGILNINDKVMAISPDDTVRYCSEKCIINDYNNHIQCAESLKKLSKLGVNGSGSEPLRLILKIFGTRKLENKKIIKDNEIPLVGKQNTYENVKCLEAAKSFIDIKTIEELKETAKTIASIANEYKLIIIEDEVLHLLLAIQCNAHQILDDNERAIGLGLFPFTSMLNHSCSPNCAHHFEITSNGIPKLIMRAIEDINPGDEVCYSYVNLYQSTTSRQLQLQKAYSFTCNCLRCTNIDLNDNCIDEINSNSEEDVTILGNKIQSYASSLNTVENPQEAYDDLTSILIELIPLTNIYHKYVLQCYIAIAKTGYLIASSSSSSSSSSSQEKTLEILKYSFSFLLLALGCIYRMTNIKQNETGELELLIARILFLINTLETKTFDNNDFSNIILDMIKANGELNLYLNPDDNDVQNLIRYGYDYSKKEFRKLNKEKKVIKYEDLYVAFANTGIDSIRCCKGDEYVINTLLKDLHPELTVGYLYF